MLPSMPILFTRDSQDAFGNKIEPSTSFFNPNSFPKPIIQPEPPPPVVAQEVVKVPQKEPKSKTNPKKKVDPPKIDDNALETALVRSYYTKVQSRFSSNTSVPTNKFVQFQSILKSFDPTKETPVDLYRKIENVFGEEHKDIVEEFLLFLKPGQAAEVGRFMDHFMLVQMTGFIELLQSTLSRKPTVLRKVLRAITTGINSGSSEEMRKHVLPHLRSNPRLATMFKSLFPDERPPDSAYETGVDMIDEGFLTNDKGYDVWEFEEESDNKRKLDVKESLDTVYLHGRVFLQHGRLLRSARVTYPYSKEPYRVHARRLAPTHTLLSPPDSDDERSSPKRNAKNTPKIPPKKAKKILKSPTKSVKDVNDNTKHKDCANLLSPKTTKKSQTNSKSKCKKEPENKTDNLQKRERKDSKSQTVQKKDEGSKAKQPKIETVVSMSIEPKKVEKKERSCSWTREEDKTMLQVLKGEAGSEQVFGRIRELLPHRSASEIKERFCHVMTLLQQMAVGEVT
ncbi:uncharacterized protein LOC110371282 [Helicoverpa armigera]|uniref:uncharacterized protein LOC110371282 n=1 Tax=Helicoverpa armigera TaxID=29058 RepID=UPI000B390E4F|nr:hypothetical protein B5X24_HaOG208555 [Helicoverpa armigera]